MVNQDLYGPKRGKKGDFWENYQDEIGDDIDDFDDDYYEEDLDDYDNDF